MSTAEIIEEIAAAGIEINLTEDNKLESIGPTGFRNKPVFKLLVNHRDDIVSSLVRECDEQANIVINKLELKDDRDFVIRKLQGISGYQRLAIVTDYVLTWQEAAKDEPIEFRKQNSGRRAANTWLREFFDKAQDV